MDIKIFLKNIIKIIFFIKFILKLLYNKNIKLIKLNFYFILKIKILIN